MHDRNVLEEFVSICLNCVFRLKIINILNINSKKNHEIDYD